MPESLRWWVEREKLFCVVRLDGGVVVQLNITSSVERLLRSCCWFGFKTSEQNRITVEDLEKSFETALVNPVDFRVFN